MPATINANLQQQGRFGIQQQFQIVNGKEIRISLSGRLRQQTYSVHLLALSERSRIRIHFAKSWLLIFAFSVIALLAYFIAKTQSKLVLPFNEMLFIAGFSLIALVCLVMFVLKISRRKVFYSRYAKVDLFELLYANPDSQSYKNFINKLTENLQQCRQFWELKPDQQIAGEMRMLRRLAKEGVITQDRYERAKDKLLALSANSRT